MSTHNQNPRDSQQLEELLALLRREIVAGLSHGFFEYGIRGEVGKHGRLEVVFAAGKSFKFHISPEELERRR